MFRIVKGGIEELSDDLKNKAAGIRTVSYTHLDVYKRQLLGNAVKYTPAGGKISVSVVLWEMYVEIKVTDTGKGISESNQAAIFRRFYREEEVHLSLIHISDIDDIRTRLDSLWDGMDKLIRGFANIS